MDNFLGKDNFTWFVGVVEDRQDPLKLGRMRVRCYGWHASSKTLPTDKLPWAHPIQPITSASMSGIGQSPIGPVEGTHVVGFFADGPNAQQPVIMGSIGGIPARETSYRNGGSFKDPFGSERGDRPNGPYPLDSYLGEPSQNESGREIYPDAEADTNRLARGVTMNPDLDPLVGMIHEAKVAGASAHLGHKTANGHEDGISWSEFYPPYGATYPYNHVRESESGHTIEIDDTPGAERLHVYHRSGSFQEIHPDGSKVDKTVNNYQNFILGTAGIHITGETDVLIGGMKDDEKGYRSKGDDGGWPHVPVNDVEEQRSRFGLLIRGTTDIQLDQGFTAHIHATAGTDIYGPALTNVFNNTITNISQNQTLAVAETSSFSAKNTNVTSTENLTIHTEEDTKLRSNDDLSIETKDDFTIVTTGDLTIKTKGNVKIETKGDFRHDVEGNYVLNVKGDEGIKLKVTDPDTLHQVLDLDPAPFPLEIELE